MDKESGKRKQGPTESVNSYYSSFKKVLKRTNIENNISVPQQLHYFIRGLLLHLAPIVSMQSPKTIADALKVALAYESGQDLNNEEEPRKPSRTTRTSYDNDPIDSLTKKFEKLQLNLAEQLKLLTAQVEKQNQ